MGCRPSSPEPHPDTESDRNSPTPNDQPTAKSRNYRPSIASLQIPKDVDDISSDGMRWDAVYFPSFLLFRWGELGE